MGISCKKSLGKTKSIMQKLENSEMARKERIKNATRPQKKATK